MGNAQYFIVLGASGKVTHYDDRAKAIAFAKQLAESQGGTTRIYQGYIEYSQGVVETIL